MGLDWGFVVLGYCFSRLVWGFVVLGYCFSRLVWVRLGVCGAGLLF